VPDTLPSAALAAWKRRYRVLHELLEQVAECKAELRNLEHVMADDPETAKNRAIWQRAYHRRHAEKESTNE
jgi:hypothetical protein